MASTVPVKAAIRKIDDPKFNKEFVLFIKKDNGEVVSVLVQDDIIEGSLESVREAYNEALKNDLEGYYSIKPADYEQINIKTNARGVNRNDLTESFDIGTVLDNELYYRTSTTDHRHYLKK